jgi:hypothetical protein
LSVKIIRAFSGTHGTGKTTSAYHQANQEKMFNPGKSVHALCNLEAFSPWPINRDGSEQTQAWLFANQIKQEISAMRRFDARHRGVNNGQLVLLTRQARRSRPDGESGLTQPDTNT